MGLVEERRKDELVDRIAARVRSKRGKREPAEAATFIRQLYAHVPPDDILAADPDDLHGAGTALWTFAQNRKPGTAKSRVYNPVRETEGYYSSHTVIEIVNDDMPFLVDSVTAELNRQGHAVHLVVHPILRIRRDARGRLLELLPPDAGPDGGLAESFMHIEIDEEKDPEALAAIESGLAQVLADVRVTVADWREMRRRAEETIAELDLNPPPDLAYEEVAEGRAFLQWLIDDHFTFIGYREYETVGRGAKARMVPLKDAGLGVLRDPAAHVFEGVRQLGRLPKQVRAYLEQPRLLIINKANRKSTVHRPVHLDAIGLKRFDEKGKVVGERLFAGLFTSAAYNRVPRDIPLLRRKVDITIARSGFSPASHDGKALQNILETLPRDELFQMSEDELFEISTGILHLQERQRVALFCRVDNFQRFVSCLVYTPRERYGSDLRKRFQRILEEAFNGPTDAYDTQIAKESILARVHYVIKTRPGEIPAFDVADIEHKLRDAARSWTDGLQWHLIRARGEDAGIKAFRRYADAFPAAYREAVEPALAVEDIAHIDRVLDTDALDLHLYRPADSVPTEVHLNLYHRHEPIPLSDVLPLLEHMGLKVVSEVPYHIRPDGRDPIWIHDFGMVRRDGDAIEPEEVRDDFQEAFSRVWAGEMEDDGFNELVIDAGLTWREVVLLRATCKYLRQTGITYSQAYMEETLAANPALARLIVELFGARFDPERQGNGATSAQAVRDEIEKRLDDVASLDQDRIVRRFVNFVESGLRTNFYQTAEHGGPKSYVSIKLDSQLLDELPLPRPFREIFVYSPRVEGVHLRFGKVARGGLRWSDRREDFRTEVLGLVKAQQVKNAVIVPVGSKGGFVVKRPPAGGDREAHLNEGVACYKTFISGMLDITDNLVAGEVAAPPAVVRHDDDDPYLVVAADKGTATFSDIANGVSADYGFWLDDAFASGGSAGYDHKKMGITARGAWESVKRHFREMGHDTQTRDFTVIGCGDMSGDVFGNGMLLSKHIRLIGAFNHLHIFVDPHPDPGKSWAERKRLFDIPRSGWSDYDPDLVSRGGGVFERTAKSIRPSPEMKQLFGLKRDKLTPAELIHAMLETPADLLWFGGIGTYVKASEESHTEVGDRANDALRVDGQSVTARVLGEGANLGATQRGRIEYSLAGGRLNTDAVDNSAGVDCSDHEVNIKILLRAVMEETGMTRDQRNKLLHRMTDEVATHVLRHNYLQTQCLSVSEWLGSRILDRLWRFMRNLEREGRLDRAIEFLPDDEAMADRKTANRGLTRPELSVLLAYAKITLYDALLESDVPDETHMTVDLHGYFPKPLREKYAKQIEGHRLRREIIATVTTNDIVNRVGITFVHDVMDKTGCAAADVVRAYIVARDVFDMAALWKEIEALDNKVPADLQSRMMAACGRLTDRATVWLLRNLPQPLAIDATIEDYLPGVQSLVGKLEKILSDAHLEGLGKRMAVYTEAGAPDAVARRVASLDLLVPACDVVRIAHDANIAVDRAARVYFSIGERFGLDWLRLAAQALPFDTHWDKQAVAAIVDDLYGHQNEIAVKVLGAAGKTMDADAAVTAWSEQRPAAYQRASGLLEELRASGQGVDLAMLAVANRQLRALAAS